MSIGLTLDQGKWKRAARQVATEVLAPHAEAVDREGRFPRESLRALGERGIMGLLVPKEHGGAGVDMLTIMLAIEQLAWGCASTAMCYVMHSGAVLPLVAAAGEDQVERFVRPAAEGRLLFSLSASEPGSGSHLWHMDSHSERDGDAYVVDAFKSWATSAGESDYYVVPVRRARGAAPDDLNMFLVDARDPGVQPVGRWDGMGMRGNSSTPVRFERCRVPERDRLGREGAGFSLLMGFNISIYLLGLGALYVGLAQRAYEHAVDHVGRRKHADTGKQLARLEVVQQYVAEMRTAIDRSRAFLYDVSRLVDRVTKVLFELSRADLLDDLMETFYEEDLLLQVAEVKIDATEMAIKVADLALQVCGGSGYRRGQVVERVYRDVRAGTLMAPDNDTLRSLIGRRSCGLPYPWKE